MNARYYVKSIGRFASADTIIPYPNNPQSHNRFSYGYNNPVKYTDPTGHYVVDSDDGEISPPIPEENDDGDVDVTEWLIWQMKWNSQGEDAEKIREDNTIFPFGDGDRLSAYSLWRELVQAGGPWDFKPLFIDQEIDYVIIDGKLFRMDIVANIHYGFVGNQVGFTLDELYIGAGYAQQCCGDADKGSIFYFGDEPVDAHAIQFGFHLSKLYGTDFTYDEFISLFNRYVDAGLFDDYRPVFA